MSTATVSALDRQALALAAVSEALRRAADALDALKDLPAPAIAPAELPLLTRDEACRLLGIGRTSLDALTKEHPDVVRRPRPRKVLYERAALLRAIRRG